MKLKPKITLLDHFSNLTDPRIDRTKDHKLIDILAIAICGMISGADNWVAMEQYGHAKQEWLKQFLELQSWTVTSLLVQWRHAENYFVGPIKPTIIPRYGYSRSSCMPQVPNEQEEA